MPNPNENDKRFQSIRREFRANDLKLLTDLKAIGADTNLTPQRRKDMRAERFNSHSMAFSAYLEALSKGFQDDNGPAIDAAHEALKKASAAVNDARAKSAALSVILKKLTTAASTATTLVNLFD